MAKRARRGGGVETFTCSRCGQVHEGPPLSYGADVPEAWAAVPAEERLRRVVMSAEQCIIDKRDSFVRARLVIPVIDGPGPFEWGVWVLLRQRDFVRMAELWSAPGRESEPPYPGLLQTELPGYPSTVNLKTLVHTQPVGQRPTVELEPTDHPLAREQRDGITAQRVREIAEMLLHPQQG
jgi:hypothetical protein